MVTMFIRPSRVQKLESKCMLCDRESHNEHDRYAVVVYRTLVVSFLPRAVSRICSLFLCRSGRTTREVAELL